MRALAVILSTLLLAPFTAADSFDYYLNRLLERLPKEPGVDRVKTLTPLDLSDHDQVLPGVKGALVVVKSNEGRMAKLLVEAARQKVSKEKSLPILILHRYVTYRDGEDKTVVAHGRDVRLFAGFRFNLDIGQVVPEDYPADVRFVADGENVHLEPVGSAEMYLVTKHHPDAKPSKSDKVVVTGDKFEPRYINGTYKIYDDGRRSGTLTLKLRDNNKHLLGHYYSDKDGAKYDVEGNIGAQPHLVQFRIIFPRTQQEYFGYVFTGDARVIAGFSRLQERETGFYAVREE
jgi:hypothetical protein